MSFGLIGLNRNVWQKAFILGKRGALLPRSGTAFARNHNNLYQMVKKRTLEARTKSKSSQFSNKTISEIPNNSINSSKKSQNLLELMNKEDKPVLSENAEVLRAKQFTCAVGGGGGGSSGGGAIGAGSLASGGNAGSRPPGGGSRGAAGGSGGGKGGDGKGGKDSGICFPAEPAMPKEIDHDDMPTRCPPKSEQAAKKPAAKPVVKRPQDSCLASKSNKIHPLCQKGGKGGGGDDCPIDWWKIIAALLAGLGLGGLLFWLLFGKKGDKSKADVKVTGSGAGGLVGGATGPLLKSSDLPKHVPYLLIGGGTAAFSAFRAIKSNDPTAKVLMITNEPRKPYMRPPLSKELWYSANKGEISPDLRFKQWTGSERSLFFEPDEFFVDPKKLTDMPNGGIAVANNFTVKKIDPTQKIVTLGDGYEITYDECLIATGCSPKNLHVFQDAPPGVRDKVMVYRTPEDFGRLKRYADEGKSITIIGNGFIGSELACSLANYGKDKGVKLYQVFQEKGNMSRVIPDYLSAWTMRKIEEQGVCVVPNAKINKAERDESQLKLHLNNGQILLTDVAVVCVGCDPNTKIAQTSGLEVDRELGGFLVNAELEARRHLFVAGDASCFYDPLLGRRRVEHHDHSVVSGRLAGENMVGLKKPYAHQSMFWSDLGPEVGYEGIGLVDASLPTVGVFALQSQTARTGDNLTENRDQATVEDDKLTKSDGPAPVCPPNADDYARGVIFYLKDEKVVGVLLWNLFNRIGLARTIINQNKKYEDLNEVAKLFEIHA